MMSSFLKLWKLTQMSQKRYLRFELLCCHVSWINLTNLGIEYYCQYWRYLSGPVSGPRLLCNPCRVEAGQGQQTEMTEDGDAGKLKESCHICGKQVMSYFLFWVGDI